MDEGCTPGKGVQGHGAGKAGGKMKPLGASPALRSIELSLEETSKIAESNHQPSATLAIKPCP